MKKKLFALILAAMMVFAALTGCGASMSDAVTESMNQSTSSSGGSDYKSEPEMDMEYTEDAAPEEAPADSEMGGGEADAQRKIIRNANFSMETLEYDKTVAAIEALVESCGGYVESSQTTGAGATDNYYRSRWAEFTVRIPAGNLNGFSDSLGECGSVTNSHFFTEEVTEYYYDTEAHMKSLQLQEERLLEILSKAEQLDEVIVLESSLADVRYQIESLQGTLRRLDSKIEMSTVNISVQEVYEYTPEQGRAKTLGERISDEFAGSMRGLRRSVEDLIVFVVGNIVGIVIWVAIIVCVVLFFRRLVRRIRRRRHPLEQSAPPTDDTPDKE